MNKCKLTFCLLACVAFLAVQAQALTEDEDVDLLDRQCWDSLELIRHRIGVAVGSLNGELSGYSDPSNAVAACRKAASALINVKDWPEKYETVEALAGCRQEIVSTVQTLKDVCRIFCTPEWSIDYGPDHDYSDPYINLDVQLCG